MEAKLKRRDPLHGEDGWRRASLRFLLRRLKMEVAELTEEIDKMPKGTLAAVMEEAVDVGNFAHMIFDLARDNAPVHRK